MDNNNLSGNDLNDIWGSEPPGIQGNPQSGAYVGNTQNGAVTGNPQMQGGVYVGSPQMQGTMNAGNQQVYMSNPQMTGNPQMGGNMNPQMQNGGMINQANNGQFMGGMSNAQYGSDMMGQNMAGQNMAGQNMAGQNMAGQGMAGQPQFQQGFNAQDFLAKAKAFWKSTSTKLNAMTGGGTFSPSANDVSWKEWLISMIIAAIPIVGIFMACVWAFGEGAKPSKKAYFRIYVIMMVVAWISFMILRATLLRSLSYFF